MPSTTHCELVLPDEIQPLLNGKTVFCSFSGGADSLALLLFLKEWSRRISFSLQAVHFEHGFRGADSLADAAFCRDICRRENIPFQLFHIDVPAHRLKGEGDEEAARRLRLDYWRKIVHNPGSSLIALGHHADDRIENVLLRLFRGSNASGLSSMRAVQKLDRLTLIRPFIESTRAEIEIWLMDRGEKCWCHDSTNASDRYRRNFLRLDLIPAIKQRFPFAPDGILQSIHTLEADAVCLEELAQKEFGRIKTAFSVSELAAIPPALRARMLRLFLQQELGLASFVPDSRLLQRFEKLVERPRNSARIPIHGLPGHHLVLMHGIFELQTVGSGPDGPVSWDPLENPVCEWNGEITFRAEILPPDHILYSRDKSSACFDLEAFRGHLPLSIGSWEPGDKIIPFGKNDPVRLKKLFADEGIGTSERADYPVLRSSDGMILWAAFLRNSNTAVVTPETKQVLRLTAARQPRYRQQ